MKRAERALPARRHRPRLYLHPVAAACAVAVYAMSTASMWPWRFRRHVARRVLAAGRYRRNPAPLHDARNCVLTFRADDAQHGPARLFGEIIHTEGLHPRPRSVLGALSGQLASRLQPVAPRRRLRHARTRSGLPAAGPPRRQDDPSGVDGHRVDQRTQTAKEKMGAETFANGDQTLTLIKTEKAVILWNTTSIRPVPTAACISGHKFANKYRFRAMRSVLLRTACRASDHENLSGHSFIPAEARKTLMERYSTRRPRHRRQGPSGGRPRGMGSSEHGLPAGLLPAARPSARSGRLRRGRMSCIGALTAASFRT